MTPERLKEIKERWATSFDKDAPGERTTAVRELVAEVERLQGIVRWREEPVDKRLHGDLMRAATKSSHELIAVTVERDGLKRGVGHLAAERDSLAAKLAVAREALAWYANQHNYDAYAQTGIGDRARAALALIDGDGAGGKGGT